MKEMASAITGRGQVTIPTEVRKHVGRNKREKVSFIIDNVTNVKPRRARTRCLERRILMLSDHCTCAVPRAGGAVGSPPRDRR